MCCSSNGHNPPPGKDFNSTVYSSHCQCRMLSPGRVFTQWFLIRSRQFRLIFKCMTIFNLNSTLEKRVVLCWCCLIYSDLVFLMTSAWFEPFKRIEYSCSVYFLNSQVWHWQARVELITQYIIPLCRETAEAKCHKVINAPSQKYINMPRSKCQQESTQCLILSLFPY